MDNRDSPKPTSNPFEWAIPQNEDGEFINGRFYFRHPRRPTAIQNEEEHPADRSIESLGRVAPNYENVIAERPQNGQIQQIGQSRAEPESPQRIRMRIGQLQQQIGQPQDLISQRPRIWTPDASSRSSLIDRLHTPALSQRQIDEDLSRFIHQTNDQRPTETPQPSRQFPICLASIWEERMFVSNMLLVILAFIHLCLFVFIGLVRFQAPEGPQPNK